MLKTTNYDDIDQITCIPKLLRTRIKIECKTMKDRYDSLFVECSQDGDIKIGVTKSTNKFIFNIYKDYPFSPPRVTLNGINQHRLLSISSRRFLIILRYITGLECLCCESLLCKNNWSPALTLHNIIIQLEEYKNIKRNIQLKILADQIKEKYLNRDINLDCWLFNVSVPHLCLPGSQYH
jgi:hypothetical protein